MHAFERVDIQRTVVRKGLLLVPNSAKLCQWNGTTVQSAKGGIHGGQERGRARTRRLLMANVKKGQTVRPMEWWKHFRPWLKRRFWHRQRRDDRKNLRRAKDEADC